jgi:phosphotransferase system  glucose/maltose/N-acetylglucosamine-specific IIC component
MKQFLNYFYKVFTITTLVIYLLALGLMRRSDITIAFRPLFWGGILTSLSITLAVVIFKKTWGNGVLNVIFGYLIMSPIPIFLRWMYGTYLFRRSFAIYILGLIYAVGYSLVILYASIRNRKTEDKLNEMLKSQPEEKEK